ARRARIRRRRSLYHPRPLLCAARRHGRAGARYALPGAGRQRSRPRDGCLRGALPRFLPLHRALRVARSAIPGGRKRFAEANRESPRSAGEDLLASAPGLGRPSMSCPAPGGLSRLQEQPLPPPAIAASRRRLQAQLRLGIEVEFGGGRGGPIRVTAIGAIGRSLGGSAWRAWATSASISRRVTPSLRRSARAIGSDSSSSSDGSVPVGQRSRPHTTPRSEADAPSHCVVYYCTMDASIVQ